MKQNLKNALLTILYSVVLGFFLWLFLTIIGVFK